jgi:hypothetical protein
MSGYLESYLVRLGAAIDQGSWSKFDVTLLRADRTVTNFTSNVALNFVKFEAAVLSSLTTAGVGLITLADKTAMADQQYRLFGMRMLMNKDSARAMQMATEELGASLDQIAYDPELNRRFQYLYEQNIKLGKTLGDNFDKNMISIRDLRMEYERLSKETDILAAGAISTLFTKLGYSSGDLDARLSKLNDWFIEKIPEWSDKISSGLIPVWENWIVLGKDLSGMFKTAAGDFIYLGATLSGDDSIKSTEFNLTNLGKTALDVADGLTAVALRIGILGKAALHEVNSVSYFVQEMKSLAGGDTKGFERFRDLRNNEDKSAASDFFGLNDPDSIGSNPDFKDYLNFQKERTNPNRGKYKSLGTDSHGMDIMLAIKKASKDLGLPEDIIYAQWATETGNFTDYKSKEGFNNLGGMRIPGSKQFEKFSSLDEFVDYYEGNLRRNYGKVFDSKGDPKAFASALKHGRIGSYFGTDSETDYAAALASHKRDYDYSNGGVVIQQLTINVPHSLPDEQWDSWVKRAIKDEKEKTVRKTTAQVAGGAYY